MSKYILFFYCMAFAWANAASTQTLTFDSSLEELMMQDKQSNSNQVSGTMSRIGSSISDAMSQAENNGSMFTDEITTNVVQPPSNSENGSQSSRSCGQFGCNGVRGISSNGTVSGNQSWIVTCNSGERTAVIRKGNRWTDSSGYSYSDRLWQLSIEGLAAAQCS